jgi:hypothetical protein
MKREQYVTFFKAQGKYFIAARDYKTHALGTEIGFTQSTSQNDRSHETGNPMNRRIPFGHLAAKSSLINGLRHYQRHY